MSDSRIFALFPLVILISLFAAGRAEGDELVNLQGMVTFFVSGIGVSRRGWIEDVASMPICIELFLNELYYFFLFGFDAGLLLPETV